MKRASTLRCTEKQVLLKRIKAAINRCFLKQVFWKFKQAITDCIKFGQVFENPLMEFIFSKCQLEAFNFIKFKNEILRN